MDFAKLEEELVEHGILIRKNELRKQARPAKYSKREIISAPPAQYFRLAKELLTHVRKFSAADAQNPRHLHVVAYEISKIKRPQWLNYGLNASTSLRIDGEKYTQMLAAAFLYSKDHSNATTPVNIRNFLENLPSYLEKQSKGFKLNTSAAHAPTTYLPKSYVVNHQEIKAALKTPLRNALFKELEKYSNLLDYLRSQSRKLASGRFMNHHGLGSVTPIQVNEKKLVAKFYDPAASAQAIYTYEPRATTIIKKAGLNVPTFHGFIEQNGVLLAIYDEIPNTEPLFTALEEDRLHPKVPINLAKHLAKKHAAGIAGVDVGPRVTPSNILVNSKGQVWEIDHELSLVNSKDHYWGAKGTFVPFNQVVKKEYDYYYDYIKKISPSAAEKFKREYEKRK